MSAALASTALLSGLFAAAVAIAVTRAIELLGGTLGGVLATLPTTMVPASVGFAQLAGLAAAGAAPPDARVDTVVAALFTVPSGTLVSSAFLAVWRFLPPALPQRWPLRVALPVMVATSLATWAACAAASVSLARLAASPVAWGAACFCAQGLTGLAVTARHREAPRGRAAVPLAALLARGALAGVSIAFAVFLSAAAGDGGVAAGMASAFPAIFLSVQVSLWLGNDRAVQGGAVGPMMLGHLAVPLYAMLFAVFAPRVGIWPALPLAWAIAVATTSLPAFAWLRWRAAVAAAKDAATAGGAAPAAAADAADEGAGAGSDAAADAESKPAPTAAPADVSVVAGGSLLATDLGEWDEAPHAGAAGQKA